MPQADDVHCEACVPQDQFGNHFWNIMLAWSHCGCCTFGAARTESCSRVLEAAVASLQDGRMGFRRAAFPATHCELLWLFG